MVWKSKYEETPTINQKKKNAKLMIWAAISLRRKLKLGSFMSTSKKHAMQTDPIAQTLILLKRFGIG